ncbi:MAG: rhodanese-like domain-containing protein [Pseudomonadota bacterium]
MSEIPPSRGLSRRGLLIGGAATLGVAGIAMVAVGARDGYLFAALSPTDRFSGDELSPPDVLAAVQAGEVLLVDIRRPDEWERTGIAEGAAPLDMRRDDFLPALEALVEGDVTRPIALICARGVRSDRLSARLTASGFTRIIDVPEGMMGSPAGPGWIARGLPLVQV